MPKGNSMRILFSLLALVLPLVTLTGCETLAYYAQAVGGQVSLMSRTQSVERLLADPTTPPSLRARLEELEQLLRQARNPRKQLENAGFTLRL